jgi:putative FmdB family regulatory protein
MPIYEYVCAKCHHEFEALVPRPTAKAPCPECGGKKVTKKMSAPAGFSMGAASDVAPCGQNPENCGAGP